MQATMGSPLARTAVACLALLAVASLAIVSMEASRKVELVQAFPQSDLGMLKVMQEMAGPVPKAHKAKTQQMARAKPVDKKLSIQEQYARIMQNQGYFAPWSRQNTWNDRIAINNIRKNNTPQALAKKQAQIEKENAKFKRKFSSPHTSMYTGTHESIDKILDPKYQPWANQAARKAYYQGY